MKVKVFVALPANMDHHLADKLKAVMTIGDGDIMVSKAKSSKAGYNDLAKLFHKSFGLTDLVIVADKEAPFSRKMNYGFLQLVSQHCNLRYWTIDSKNHDSVHRILRKASLVTLSAQELVNRAKQISSQYGSIEKDESRLRPGDNCF